MTYFIAVANQKGGVAKTTTVVSLGAALVQSNHEVLLVDLDAQANLSLALGVNPAMVRHSIADVLLNLTTISSISRETGVPGLDLVPSNAEMELAERFLPVRKSFEFILRSTLNGKLPYDYVFFDCPPSMGAVTLNALNAAHLLVIPTQAEYFSAHALRNMMAAIRRVRAQSNPDLIYRILITMQDRRNRIHRHLSEQLRSAFGDGLFQNVIEVDTRLRECSVAGMPITHHSPQSRSALQYRALAQELIEHVQETATRQADAQAA
jgi:chromosome partitioning protein